MLKKLTPMAQKQRDEFNSQYSGRNCTCGFGITCGMCNHPGNPKKQATNSAIWVHEPEVKSEVVDNAVFRKSVREW